MNCKKIRNLIQSYVDGHIDGSERQQVEHHLEQCAPCAREAKSTRDLVRLLGRVPERSVSASFERELMAAVEARAPASAPAAWWERFSLHFEWRLRVPALVTAGSLAAVVLATPLVYHQQKVQERDRFISSAMERHR